MEKKYYIETSVGRMIFSSDNILSLQIDKDYYQTTNDMFIFDYCKFFCDFDLLSCCDWSTLRVKQTINGLFLYTYDCCGAPNHFEYKIYEL